MFNILAEWGNRHYDLILEHFHRSPEKPHAHLWLRCSHPTPSPRQKTIVMLHFYYIVVEKPLTVPCARCFVCWAKE